MKFKRSRAARRGRIEIIPMIDVMFFLLATFMLASLSMQRLDSLALDLPQGQAQALQGAAPPRLAIDNHDRVFVNGQPVTLPELGRALQERMDGSHTVLVAADGGASHGAVVRAMLEARKAGALHFLLGVREDG